jgi:hypothetical protein
MTDFKEIQSYLKSESFKNDYLTYIKSRKDNKLISFLDDIDTNKKYYRIGINKNQRFKKVINKDSQTIKEINSLINKLTDDNYDKIKSLILEKISADYLYPYIIENIIENSLSHHIYISLYVNLLNELNFTKKNTIIVKTCDKYYNELFMKRNTDSKSSYENLCNENKKLDNIIGYSLLISHLEKENIINKYIDKVIDPFVNDLLRVEDEKDIYKMLVSFYSISQIHYTIIPERYQKILKQLKVNTTSSKIRFKIMDILGE